MRFNNNVLMYSFSFKSLLVSVEKDACMNILLSFYQVTLFWEKDIRHFLVLNGGDQEREPGSFNSSRGFPRLRRNMH